MRVLAATIPAEALKVRPRDAYYARQKRLFALASVLVAVVPLVVLDQRTSRFYRESWMERTSVELAGMARDRRALVDLFLQGEEAQLASAVALRAPAELAGERLESLFRAMSATHALSLIHI